MYVKCLAQLVFYRQKTGHYALYIDVILNQVKEGDSITVNFVKAVCGGLILRKIRKSGRSEKGSEL